MLEQSNTLYYVNMLSSLCLFENEISRAPSGINKYEPQRLEAFRNMVTVEASV